MGRYELFGTYGTDSYNTGNNPTPGTATGNINIINSYSTTRDNTRGVAVQIGAMGGDGGNGHEGRGLHGAAGGNGGSISLVQNGALVGRQNQQLGWGHPGSTLSDLCGARGKAQHLDRTYNCSTKQTIESLLSVVGRISATKYYTDSRWLNRGGALLMVYSQGGNGGNSTGYLASTGGQGGTIDLTVNSAVAAEGKYYGGVWARSVGGNSAPGARTKDMDEATYAGGNGGTVSVTVGKNASVSTIGASAPAIIVESLAGWAYDQNRGSSFTTLIGAKGGDGGKVTFRNAGSITSNGDSSPGVLIQSAGGTGGRVAVGWDGTGGKGGKGGDVVATNGASIATSGMYSFGLFALSAGGNGGRGAVGYFGSDGGPGGPGGTLAVSNFGTITTNGEGSVGMVAQSVAGGNPADAFQMTAIVPGMSTGGGGRGGFGLFVGGDGGSGGNGGTVRVVQGGTIKTDGKGAVGVVAQSVGGGGGDGGSANGVSPWHGIALGGRGGGGGDGGEVYIRASNHLDDATADATLIDEKAWAFSLASGTGRATGEKWSVPSITTTGDKAAGILALSVGGGGGFGGSAAARTAGVADISVAIGGAGGDGGKGGKVVVDNESIIHTSGREAAGISASSIGGGGGVGGNASAYALAVAPPNMPTFSLTFTVGGTGGKGGAGGSVTVNNRASITTTGASSEGMDLLSVGGGGGYAGAASSVSDALGFLIDVPIAITLGGKGGDGGDGGAVSATNWDKITTSGGFSRGISAISIGGGGGKGGSGEAKANQGISWNDVTSTVTGILPTAVSVGGQFVLGGGGGKGGAGGTVGVVNAGSILTEGANAKAIHAQSVGGGGGDAGGYLASGGGMLTGTLQLGGDAGKEGTDGRRGGGAGGKVTVDNHLGALIGTQGHGSVGIFAQSVGGGGGDGGSFTGTIKAAPTIGDDPWKFVVQLGGELLKANDVATYVRSRVATEKADEGESKDAKTTITVEDKENAKKALNPLDKDSSVQDTMKHLKAIFKIVKVGLELKEGAEGLDPSQRTTYLLNALPLIPAGILLNAFESIIKDWYKGQKFAEFNPSIPNVNLTGAVGGKGGAGGNGGEVTIVNAGTVTTRGNTSTAILAQSVGGGGGRGGAAVAAGDNKLNINLSIGGTGGDGGDGGTVTIRNVRDAATGGGIVTTHGDASFALFAQSVGGGGGIGGAASSANSISLHVDAKVGGSGGKSSKGGTVTVENSGVLATSGRDAHALVAQSVGGGGGALLISRVDPDAPEVLTTSKEAAEALREAEDMLKTVADTTLKSANATEVEKASAQQIINQLAKNRSEAAGGGTGDVSSTILPTPSVGGSIGGTGGGGGAGGEVKVTHTGTITTTGLGAMGIFAQSIGGGGGFGADAGSDGFLANTAKLGGTGGTGGNGGPVAILLQKAGAVSTSGEAAHGVFVQSIGGGGGYGGVSTGRPALPIQVATLVTEFFVDPSGVLRERKVMRGADGNGGTIKVDLEEKTSIKTTGKRAHGIYAQSLGAGGGTTYFTGTSTPVEGQSRGALMTGVGGAITITNNGIISAKGEDAYGVFLQSGVQKTDGTLDPTRAGGVMTVETFGSITGGSGKGAAVRVEGGLLNNINSINVQKGGKISAASGTAVIGTFGREQINNNGTITGDLNLVEGGSNESNVFFNYAGGVYNSRAGLDGVMKLGNSGLFENTGILSIGGDGAIGKLHILSGGSDPNGVAEMRFGGTMRVDVDSLASGQKSDFLTVDGQILLQGGKILPHVVENLTPFSSFTIAQATNGISYYGGHFDASYSLTVAPTPGSPITWAIDRNSARIELKATSADFAGAAHRPLSDTERAMVESWQGDWDKSNTNPAKLFGKLANITSVKDYQDVLESTSPEGLGQPAMVQTQNVSTSLSAAMSCPVFVDTGTMINESQCVWTRIIGSQAKTDDTWSFDGATQNAITYRIGGQWEIAEGWFLGATAGYTSSWGETTDSYTSFQGNGGDVSLALKHQVGPWLFAGSAHLGYGVNTIQNLFDVGDASWQTSNDSTVWTGGLRARAAYEFAFSGWYVRPFVDFDVIYTHAEGYTAQGQLFDMQVGNVSEWTFAVHPAVEIGARLDLSPDTWLRPYFTTGITYLTNDGLSTQVDIYDNVRDGNAFISTTYMPDFLVDLGVGLQLFAQDKYELRGEYKAQIGEHFLGQEGSLRLATRF
ncbi:autotransporter outer membrane beta-barrel domain-containing protein [Aquabacter sp. CN5-332]|uniref:autotransporter outer membrane beta-barrel domain-containing protein n=1 Tax=Aquabacter sp. CN5-332 TaxID=3156608 RepID=UPI0032B4FE2E